MANPVFFNSGTTPKSAILTKTLTNRLNSLYGFRLTTKPTTQLEKRTGLKFVRVDINNPGYRVKQAFLGNIFQTTSMSSQVEKYFNSWINETGIGYEDIRERQVRLNDLFFMYCNDAFIARCTHLVADEATQLGLQDRLIQIESPNLDFVKNTYSLFSQWGVSQPRANAVCFDIQLYGESFWATKVSQNGVEKIYPLQPSIIKERLEFNPMKVAEFLARRDAETMFSNKGDKVKKLVKLLRDNSSTLDVSENITDIFETKLLGYELVNEQLIPPWSITHFRYNADHSEFHPYGRPPMLAALAPFKLTLATKTLQGLARALSFPIKCWKVKTKEQMTTQMSFRHVENVKEQYDNIPVDPAMATSEVYNVNTEVWFPEDLLDLDIKENKVDLDFTGDLEMYQDLVVVACGIPKGYLVQEWGGFGNSAVSLIEQFKPFADHVYTIQATFLQELGNLIRLHYAITGEFDYNTPFVLSMRFPAQATSDEHRSAQSSSLELAQAVVETIVKAVGMEEGETLPEDIVIDILSKYSFLDETDIQKWVNKAKIYANILKLENDDDEDEEGGEDDDGGFGDFDDEGGGDDDFGGGDFGGGDMEESNKKKRKAIREVKKLTKKQKETRLKEMKRMRELTNRYEAAKEDIYFKVLKEQGFSSFQKQKRHHRLIAELDKFDPMWETISAFRKERLQNNGNNVLRESDAKALNTASFDITDYFDLFEEDKKIEKKDNLTLTKFIEDKKVKPEDKGLMDAVRNQVDISSFKENVFGVDSLMNDVIREIETSGKEEKKFEENEEQEKTEE